MIDYAEKVNIIFPWQLKSNRHLFPLPDMLSRPGHGEEDFGNLDFHPRSSFSDPISIHYADFHDAEHQREDFLNNIHDSDDDRYQPESSKEDRNNPCRKVNWAGWSFPTCNQIHEKVINRLGDEGYQVSYIRSVLCRLDIKVARCVDCLTTFICFFRSGSFRDAFRFQRQDPPDHFVMKQIILGNLGIEDVADIKKEAMILERLTPSPRVLDIYGYCGTSVVVEPMAEDLHTKIIVGTGYTFQKKLDKLDDVYPLNNFTASEKLQISLDMAESLADLHGFEGGAIIHADTHIEQWLIAPDRSIKLNDFNNAREPTWNVKKNKYCEKTSTYGGVWRSPEEYIGRPQDESIDVYAYGNNIYTLVSPLFEIARSSYCVLAGLWLG